MRSHINCLELRAAWALELLHHAATDRRMFSSRITVFSDAFSLIGVYSHVHRRCHLAHAIDVRVIQVARRLNAVASADAISGSRFDSTQPQIHSIQVSFRVITVLTAKTSSNECLHEQAHQVTTRTVLTLHKRAMALESSSLSG